MPVPRRSRARRRHPRVRRLVGVQGRAVTRADGQLRPEQRQPPRHGLLVRAAAACGPVDGSAAPCGDARQPDLRHRPPAGLWTAARADPLWTTAWAGQTGSGATQTATMPGPTWAPSTAPSSAHQTSRPSRFSASRRPAARPAARRGRGWPGARRRRRPGPSPAACDDQLLQPGEGLARRCAPSPGWRPGRRRSGAAASPTGHRRRAPQRRRSGRPGAGTPACRRRTATSPAAARSRAASTASSADPPASTTSAADSAAYPVATPTCRLSTGYDGDRGVPGGELRGLEGPAHLAGQVHRDDLVGPVRGRPLVDLEQRARGRPRGADRPELLERLGHHRRGGAIRRSAPRRSSTSS